MLKTWLYLGLLKHSGNAGPLLKFALPSGCACEGACRHPTLRLGTCSLVRETKMLGTTVNNSSARGLRPVTCKQQFSNLGSRGLHLFWIGPSKKSQVFQEVAAVAGLQAFVKRALENLNVPTELQRRVFSQRL